MVTKTAKLRGKDASPTPMKSARPRACGKRLRHHPIGNQFNRIDAMLEKLDQQLIKRGALARIVFQRLEGAFGVEDDPEMRLVLLPGGYEMHTATDGLKFIGICHGRRRLCSPRSAQLARNPRQRGAFATKFEVALTS